MKHLAVACLGLLTACTVAAEGDLSDTSLDVTCMGSSFTGRQLLSVLGPAYSVMYAPTDPNSETVDPTWVAAHATPLAITIAWAGGPIGCAPPMTECPPGPGCFQTQPTLSLALAMTFKTADGTFDEHLTARATWMPALPLTSYQTVSWEARTPSTDVAGSYRVWSGAGALGTPSQIALRFSGTFTGATPSRVAGWVQESVTSGPATGTTGGNGGGIFGSSL